MLVEEVDLDVLAVAEEAYEIRSDLRKGVISYAPEEMLLVPAQSIRSKA
jgi:hypothetical protein